MASASSWRSRFQAEIDQAHLARRSGKEGMARVCARRAVGILIGEYLLTHGLPDPGNSAYDRLQRFLELPGLSPKILQISGHFLLRVSSDHQLPGKYDLIAEALWLAEKLFPQE